MEIYLQRGTGEDFSFVVGRTHRAESRADDLRRAIEREMYAKALLPESRGDILGFLENLDRIPNRAETILFTIAAARVEVPTTMRDGVRALLSRTAEATDALLQLARRVFARDSAPLPLIELVDEKESECDFIERQLIEQVFRSEGLGDLERLMLREILGELGDLSDLAENVADRLMIMSLKRRV
jgi:predicted phosphate transport protein (TIGR00153 family)